jgi:hypothetical protein
MYSDLVTLKNALADIDSVCTCKIGIEANISPASYPLIRIVPTRMIPSNYHKRKSEVSIYFGYNVTESQGLELVYEKLLQLEAKIIKTIQANNGRYIDTITDEDRLDTYKLMVVRCEIEGDRPVVS